MRLYQVKLDENEQVVEANYMKESYLRNNHSTLVIRSIMVYGIFWRLIPNLEDNKIYLIINLDFKFEGKEKLICDKLKDFFRKSAIKQILE